ncbi:MAG: ECF transporter S component, partial [Firmicutes bacterium]|nr:ECF transporter S component [Bacillota bacterium]
GPLLDTCTVFLAPITINFKNVMAIYLAGFPVNFSQAVGTFLVLSLLGKPMLEKLERIKIKYGMLRGMEKSA